jgi:putative membrane protein insertion efficiency factor
MAMEARTNLLGLIGGLPRFAGLGLIKAYRYTLSPLMGNQCRYLPTCSHYTEDAIKKHGLWAGLWMGLARFQRCGPNGASGFDPVPDEKRQGARWYMPWRYGYWTGAHIDPKTRLDLPD